MTPIYFLDRNAISVIKDSLADKPLRDARQTKMLAELKELDRDTNHVSPLLSIIEGEHGREDSDAEKAACVIKEAAAVKNFFGKAVHDADQLIAQAAVVGQVFTLNRESGWQARSDYWSRVIPLVREGLKRPKDKRHDLVDTFMQTARDVGLEQDDALQVMFLACLFGNEGAQGLLKLRSETSYNPLNDLHVISRMGLIQAVGKSQGVEIVPQLVSMDDGLVEVLSHIEFVQSDLTADGGVSLQLRYHKGLFPHLSDGQYSGLLNRINERGATSSEAGSEITE